MPEDMPDKMPEDMSERMPEDLPVTKRLNVMVGTTRSKVIFSRQFSQELSKLSTDLLMDWSGVNQGCLNPL